ncbi:hypothetical protein, partial [Comamonas aquatica]|uniref:hypothetical protein n=1 Tax=Comamonas aquatica TaxID=225991 RepID=UPI002449C825
MTETKRPICFLTVLSKTKAPIGGWVSVESIIRWSFSPLVVSGSVRGVLSVDASAADGSRLVAVFQLKTGNDCCQRKPSLHWFVIAGPLYLSKPSLKAGLGRVTAFIGVEIEL